MDYYDVTFQELSGRTIIKRGVASNKDTYSVWQDACDAYDENELRVAVNTDVFVVMNRRYIVRIDIQKIDSPTEKQIKRHDEIMGVVTKLSNMGF
ncbi:hypothetical protein QQF78_08685 [Melissococcus plutonius]|uniref:hypothetical protein n=1 Tax=Melissococcus plutonius TaxID=33970 RepID=UPI003C2B21E0